MPSLSLPLSSTPTTSGVRKYTGWPSIAGFGLDAAHAPADDADAVDHRRVAVGADQRVGVVDAVSLVHAAREILEVHLVHDADARRHDLERVERLHAPFHELVALVVALELELHVEVERVRRAVVVDHHRVVDDQVDRHQRLDRLRILAQRVGDVAHRRQVGEQRNAGEVLQHDARDDERDLVGARAGRRPVRELRTCSSVTFLPSQLRSTDSSTMRIDTGKRATFGWPRRAQRRQRIELCRSRRRGASVPGACRTGCAAWRVLGWMLVLRGRAAGRVVAC